MKLRYGNYIHDLYEASIVITRQPQFSDAGIRRGWVETWNITGILQAASVAALTTAIQQMVAAYSVDNRELALLTASGGSTAHRMAVSDASAGEGIRVVAGPSFPQGAGAEYTTYRSYSITVEGTFSTRTNAGSVDDLESYEETIDVQGSGGPDTVLVPVLVGPWPKQQITSRTPIIITQSGSAVGKNGYPPIPGPLFPGDEKATQRRVSRRTPRLTSGSPKSYPVNWSYTFEVSVAGGIPAPAIP